MQPKVLLRSRVGKESTNTAACLPDIQYQRTEKSAFHFVVCLNFTFFSECMWKHNASYISHDDLSAGPRIERGNSNHLLISLPIAYFLSTASDKLWDHISGTELFSCYYNVNKLIFTSLFPSLLPLHIICIFQTQTTWYKNQKVKEGPQFNGKCLPCMHKALGSIPSMHVCVCAYSLNIDYIVLYLTFLTSECCFTACKYNSNKTH